MSRKKPQASARTRRTFTEEFRREAVQMLIDGHSAASVAERLGLSNPNLLYLWKKKSLDQAGPAAQSLGQRVHFLEAELRRVERERDILKKSLEHFQPRRVTDLYAAIEQILLPGTVPVSVVCHTLHVSRAGFYAWRAEEESARAQRDRELLPLVRDVFWRHKRRYGARKIAVELQAEGQAVGVDRVAKLLKIQGLAAIQPKSFVPKTTQSRHGLGYSPNFLLHAPPPTRLNEVWVADITYIPLRTGDFAYLALVMDLFSRRVVGWDIAPLMTETLVLEALRQAIGLRQPPASLIHHSDRGGQYAGAAYRAVLRRAAMRQSMSRADECTDNAFMESCFGTIKTELEMTEYDHVAHAQADIGPYLTYYNLERRHSALGYLSPIQFAALNNAPN